MAGTAANLRTDQIILGSGKIYGKVAIPAGGARATLYTDLTPDATANPSAVDLGGTQEGAKLTISGSWDEYFIDEQPDPVATNLSVASMTLEGAFAGIRNQTLMELLTPATGTFTSGAQYEQMTFGTRTLVYNSIMVIAPRFDDPTKVVVAQLYRAVNVSGLTVDFGRKKLNYSPFKFQAYSVAGRAQGDTYGTIWWQVT
jgi:hypothetical protein